MEIKLILMFKGAVDADTHVDTDNNNNNNNPGSGFPEKYDGGFQ